MADLRIVPKTEPTPKEAVIERVKKMARPVGTVQCTRCGSRSIMTVVNGSWIDGNGQYHRGTVCHDRVCYDCHKQGIFSPMMPMLPREVKPKRPKPKAVK